MQQYIGVKLINAKPMNRADYNTLRGWQLPADEDGADTGYLVEYLDGGKANHPHFEGYISWSPKEVFDRADGLVTGMTFGLALEAIKRGERVARAGWNGKGMWLSFVGGNEYKVESFIACQQHLPWIGMKTADDKFVPWLASQTDVLASDWQILNHSTTTN